MAEDTQKHDRSKLIVTMTYAELEALQDRWREELLADVRAHITGTIAAPLDRKGAAKFLGVSLAQIDKFCRERGLPHYRCGDAKRFFREELIAWLRGER